MGKYDGILIGAGIVGAGYFLSKGISNFQPFAGVVPTIPDVIPEFNWEMYLEKIRYEASQVPIVGPVIVPYWEQMCYL